MRIDFVEQEGFIEIENERIFIGGEGHSLMEITFIDIRNFFCVDTVAEILLALESYWLSRA
jgi:hypothetical protein